MKSKNTKTAPELAVRAPGAIHDSSRTLPSTNTDMPEVP